ncbi:LytTR family transcriptional regulator [Chryseobacterium fistulae]|uniref:HTH LytTR-type domain-containing protein n=1 Tax=Chryseobacterium fistulae TaxID=2675058 RepID=A0A6N4XR15_9FLAO|nr:LytTR family transcriptional regulator [Chryseobacterium fistulae]CAA7390269.1 hypothetical protein CHRY9393_02571 [Chryseobacterium fistulae]
MKKTYFLISFFIVAALAVTHYLAFIFIYNSFRYDLLEEDLRVAEYQSRLISEMVSRELESGSTQEEAKAKLQISLERSSTGPVFICMFNKEGKEICHPNKNLVGITIADDDSTVKSFSNLDLERNFKSILNTYTAYGGIHTIKDENKTEVIYLTPVRDTDWIIASHVNLISLEKTLNAFKTKLLLLFIFTWVCSIVLILFLINFLYQRYFSKITKENLKIRDEILEKQSFEVAHEVVKEEEEPIVKRFLAEKGLKLIPVEIESIAFIYLDNKIVYVVDINGMKSTLNMSLEEIFQTLPKDQFFRVSRQVILALKSIQNIEKYGLTQLKAITHPVSEVPIIISKAKVSEFKSWIGKK